MTLSPLLAGALSRDAVERVDVGPLSVAALHRTIVDRFGVTLRRPTLMRLHEMSGGNPLFALEIVRGLGDDAELAVPRDLTALLRARLAVLSPALIEVTMTAAALARPTRTLLERIEGDVDDELDEAATCGDRRARRRRLFVSRIRCWRRCTTQRHRPGGGERSTLGSPEPSATSRSGLVTSHARCAGLTRTWPPSSTKRWMSPRRRGALERGRRACRGRRDDDVASLHGAASTGR